VTDGHWHANAMAACVLVAFDLVRLIHTVQGPTSWKPCAHSILNSFLFFSMSLVDGGERIKREGVSTYDARLRVMGVVSDDV
jgi:hypothetical protein